MYTKINPRKPLVIKRKIKARAQRETRTQVITERMDKESRTPGLDLACANAAIVPRKSQKIAHIQPPQDYGH